MENTAASKKRPVGLIVGLIGGVCIVLFMTVLYKGGINVYLGPLAWLGYGIMISFAAGAALIEKKNKGGYIDLMSALKTTFTVFVIILAAQTLFIWLLVNKIDTQFKEVLTKEMLKRIEAAYKSYGLAADKIEEKMAEERSRDPNTLGGMLTSLAFTYIVFFMISLVIAAIVKKKKAE